MSVLKVGLIRTVCTFLFLHVPFTVAIFITRFSIFVFWLFAMNILTQFYFPWDYGMSVIFHSVGECGNAELLVTVAESVEHGPRVSEMRGSSQTNDL